MRNYRIRATLATILLSLVCLGICFGAGLSDSWKQGFWTSFWSGQSEDAKFGSIAQVYRVRNNQGSTISQGQPVELDGTAITVVTAASAKTAMTIANGLSGESGVFSLTVRADPDTAGNVTITGTDENGILQVGHVACTVKATSTTWVSDNLWSTVTAVDSSGIETTSTGVAITAYPFMTVNLTDATTDTLFGIVIQDETDAPQLRRLGYAAGGTIEDNDEGFIASPWKGPVKVFVSHAGGNAAVLPGDKLTLKSTGYFDEDAATPDFFTYGVVATPGATSTSTLVWAFIK